MIPFEFVVEGIPVSLQGKGYAKSNWKLKVYGEALALWTVGDLPTNQTLQIIITFFYNTRTNLDIDNILKPILDALNGLVYIDDNQVTDIVGRKREINESFINPSPILRPSLTKGVEFVHVQIQLAPDPRSL